MLQWGAAIFSELSTKWKLSACNSCKSYAACSRTDLIRVSIIDNLCSRMFKIHAGNYILTALMHSHSHRTILKSLGRVSERLREWESESTSSATNLEARGKQTNHHTQAVATPSLAHHCGMNAESTSASQESGEWKTILASGSRIRGGQVGI